MELDSKNSSRGVWLVKVPKYISQRWEMQKPMTEVGRLNITRNPQGEMEVFFTLSDQVIKTDPNADSSATTITSGESSKSSTPGTNSKNSISASSTSKASASTTGASTSKTISAPMPVTKPSIPSIIPAEHKFAISSITHQSLGVFSQDENGRLAVEGQVVQKGECRPMGDANYMTLKKETIKRASQPTKTVKQLDRAVNNYKPINIHRSELENEQRKKAEGKKMRDDKATVQNALFNAFEKHQYYNIKDLERITRQPVPYLKEVLKEICNYNAKNPHKNMWELKPEFRHYEKKKE